MPKAKDPESEGFLRFIIDVVINSVVIIILFFFVQIFVAAPFQVIGNSMYNTLHDGEYIVVSKLEYTFGEPQRGDIVVFNPPHQDKEYYIKRIVGVPGDTILLKAGDLFVNGKTVSEEYISPGLQTCVVAHIQDCKNDDKTYEVPADMYFVLGDNRKGSSDSRAWYDKNNRPNPFVSKEDIQGKTRVVLYPLPEIRLVEGTEAFKSF